MYPPREVVVGCQKYTPTEIDFQWGVVALDAGLNGVRLYCVSLAFLVCLPRSSLFSTRLRMR